MHRNFNAKSRKRVHFVAVIRLKNKTKDLPLQKNSLAKSGVLISSESIALLRHHEWTRLTMNPPV